MMKIGASMLGKSVACPDCGNRIEVPFESDPRAESLYLRMKHRSFGQTPPAPQSSAQSEPSIQQSSPKPKSRPSPPGQAQPPSSPEVSRAAIEQVDEWIEKLWADIPDSGAALEPRTPLPATDVDKKVKTSPATDSVLIRTLWNDPNALRLAAALLAIVFLVGVGSGFALRTLVVSGRSDGSPLPSPGKAIAVTGKLSFETPDEKPLPDADAVVIFLPIERIPIAPLNGSGLWLQDGTESAENEPSVIVQQIEELGGKCLRADAEGKFSFSVDAAGRYLGILISSHAVRSAETKWSAETDRNLRRFFREPAELFGNYRFRCEEYDLRKGETLSVQYNFSR